MSSMDLATIRDRGTRLAGTLTLTQKVLLGVVVVASGIGLYLFAGWVTKPDYTTLFSNLDPEDASGITLLIDMPGVPKDRLELKVEGDSLLVEGNAQPQTPPELEPIYAEVRVARFSRHFTLTRELDTTKIDANLKDGVLKLRIPKQEHVKPKRIAVNAG